MDKNTYTKGLRSNDPAIAWLEPASIDFTEMDENSPDLPSIALSGEMNTKPQANISKSNTELLLQFIAGFALGASITSAVLG